MSKTTTVEGITIDKDGHKIVIHDADEAKLASLGKKRIEYLRIYQDGLQMVPLGAWDY